MTVNHDAVAALPTIGNPNKTLVRNILVARMPYVLGDAEDSRNLIAIDPSTAAVIIDLLLFGRVFHYDPTDTTTAHDGTTCLVSADGLRYKLALGTDVFAYAVLDNTIATPPVSPALGDAYLVAAGATGAWAGKSNFIAVKTNRGWEFVNFSIGRFVYVESVDSYYHKNAGGAWVLGFGSQTLSSNSVPLSSLINVGRVFQVENQTTNTPPGSPTVGQAYLIGPSPTGAWAGNSLKIAICEVGTSFTIYTAKVGDIAYDKAGGLYYQWTGAAWKSLFGAWRQIAFVKTDSVNTAVVGSTFYAPSAAVAPATGDRKTQDLSTLTVTAATGTLLRFTYAAAVLPGAGSGTYAVALFQDALTNAVDWTYFDGLASKYLNVQTTFTINAPDSSPHIYLVAVMSIAGPVDVQIVRRKFFVEAAG